MNILNLITGKEAPMSTAGTAVPVFEKSVIHAAARDALAQINAVNAFTPEMAEEWLATSAGNKLRNLLREYIQHGHAKSVEA
jgi:hypothetical protein